MDFGRYDRKRPDLDSPVISMGKQERVFQVGNQMRNAERIHSATSAWSQCTFLWRFQGSAGMCCKSRSFTTERQVNCLAQHLHVEGIGRPSWTRLERKQWAKVCTDRQVRVYMHIYFYVWETLQMLYLKAVKQLELCNQVSMVKISSPGWHMRVSFSGAALKETFGEMKPFILITTAENR